jgi:transcriptional regulator with XRE-family HTH domain
MTQDGKSTLDDDAEAQAYATTLRASFGRHTRRGRQDLELSQRETADKLGLSQRCVSLIERGESNLTILTMAKLSRLLGTPVPTMLQPYKPASGGTG